MKPDFFPKLGSAEQAVGVPLYPCVHFLPNANKKCNPVGLQLTFISGYVNTIDHISIAY